MMIEVKTQGFVDQQIKGLVVKSIIGVVSLIVISLALSVVVRYQEMASISKTYAESERNSLLLGEYRSVKTSLLSATTRGFSSIVYLAADGSEVFSLNKDKPSFYELTTKHKI